MSIREQFQNETARSVFQLVIGCGNPRPWRRCVGYKIS